MTKAELKPIGTEVVFSQEKQAEYGLALCNPDPWEQAPIYTVVAHWHLNDGKEWQTQLEPIGWFRDGYKEYFDGRRELVPDWVI